MPQKIYSSPRDQTGGPGLLEPIMFVLKDPDQCGISCRDALFMIVSRLEGRDDEMFSGCGTSVSLRLMVGLGAICRQCHLKLGVLLSVAWLSVMGSSDSNA